MNDISIKNFFNYIFDFIAPLTCLSCNEKINIERADYSKYLCNKCLDNLILAPDYNHIRNDLIVNLGIENLNIDNAFCLYCSRENKSFLEVIHYLKYQGYKKIGIKFGKLLWKKILSENNYYNYDYIIPVPIHHIRLRERGYNQSYFICKGINIASSVTVNKNIIKRFKYTKSQTKLNQQERIDNVEGVFAMKKNANVVGRSILIVDDVLTTGSTLNNIAKLLKNNGAIRVDIATLLRA